MNKKTYQTSIEQKSCKCARKRWHMYVSFLCSTSPPTFNYESTNIVQPSFRCQDSLCRGPISINSELICRLQSPSICRFIMLCSYQSCQPPHESLPTCSPGRPHLLCSAATKVSGPQGLILFFSSPPIMVFCRNLTKSKGCVWVVTTQSVWYGQWNLFTKWCPFQGRFWLPSTFQTVSFC